MPIRDRLFLTGALRSDQNSAFGTNFQRVYYPKVSLSWQISGRRLLPARRHLQPRQQPAPASRARRIRRATGSDDALQTFNAGSSSIKLTDAPTETYNQIGNDSLRA